MSKLFFPKLALVNIKKNRKTYFPYILTCIGTVMMFYTMLFLSSNEGMMKLPGSGTVSSMMGFGTVVIGIFSAIFLFYTNSFLMKRRKKEIGLYNILGMAKRHILIVLFFETLFTGLFSLIVGLVCGILGSKLMLLLLFKILHFSAPFGFEISTVGIVTTIVVFGFIFFITLVFNLFQIHVSKPIELLRGGQTGEKEPKTKWILAVFGLITLGGGYALALWVENPIDALVWFFIAVILVMIGTYCLFTAGSIAVLKIVRRNKKFYYKTKHFTSVSGMIYRMKQNAVGLANICILSSAVLVTLSTTVSLYIGMEDILTARFPSEIVISATDSTEQQKTEILSAADQTLAETGLPVQNQFYYNYMPCVAYKQENSFVSSVTSTVSSAVTQLYFITLDDYNRINGTDIALNPDEVLLYVMRGSFKEQDVNLFGHSFHIKENLRQFPIDGGSTTMLIDSFYIVVPDQTVLQSLRDVYGQDNPNAQQNTTLYMGIDLNQETVQKDDILLLFGNLQEGLKHTTASIDCRQAKEADFYAMYGGFLFLGIFLGALFLMATVLIIYYKQISEGYDDKERFTIMQKVGMTKKEIKKTIHSQILMVFFLPLLAAMVHIAFAFKMISQILMCMNLYNIPLFALCTVGTILVFALLYAVVYSLTARTYSRGSDLHLHGKDAPAVHIDIRGCGAHAESVFIEQAHFPHVCRSCDAHHKRLICHHRRNRFAGCEIPPPQHGTGCAPSPGPVHRCRPDLQCFHPAEAGWFRKSHMSQRRRDHTLFHSTAPEALPCCRRRCSR